ncbi:MAG: hypothetical protein ACKN85_07685 [Pirellula sp.]
MRIFLPTSQGCQERLPGRVLVPASGDPRAIADRSELESSEMVSGKRIKLVSGDGRIR